ncbi:cation:proton antiporter [Parvularcula sp. LCG005]|uniref:cation:proton antiporter domain-containing protein n=1 Tax=Parvularcula sp. LCG005 TaxID=3078805 RepID=UPI002943578D|nr:cation:proton antiporter [Parvularcula sp. LCG005]WOI54133.1 cation:proton antiporter [Parvularcula sp. LCG005]
MTPLYTTIFLIFLAALFLGAMRRGALSRLSDRPLVTLLAAIALGVVYQRMGLPEIDGGLIRLVADFAIALLAFLAAQQCRIGRLRIVSPAAFRLSLFAPPLIMLMFIATGFVLVPGLDVFSMFVASTAILLGGAPLLAGPLLTAPVDEATKITSRVEGATTLVLYLPLVLLIEAGASDTAIGTPPHEQPLFLALAGFAVGGAIGLLAGRKLPPSSAALPVMPFLVAAGVYVITRLLGLDAVMATLASGIMYSHEAPIKGEVRTRLWRAGEHLLTPIGLVTFGFVIGPTLLHPELLLWVAAIVFVVAGRAAARFVALQGIDVPSQDRTFLVWLGGAPGVASALILLSIAAGGPLQVDEMVVNMAALAIVAGICLTRLTSRPLTRWLAHQTARARKRRYSPS